VFIHIGNESMIQSEQIISIINYDVVSSSHMMEDMLMTHKRNIVGSEKDAKSIIFATDAIYLSALSVDTLTKRVHERETLPNYQVEMDVEETNGR